MRIQRVCVLFMIVATFALLPQTAVACACNPYETTVLEAYERSDIVVIARLVSVDKAADQKGPFGSDISGATMVAEKVYKGDVKVSDQLKFTQGDEVLGCSLSFHSEQVGESYLLYLVNPEKPAAPLYIGTCNRSKNTKYAQEDLMYLNNLQKHHGETRISGVVDADGALKFGGLKIRIMGSRKTYVAITDDDGVYEMYGLPGGRYVVEPQLPFGWKVDEFYLTRRYRRADMNPPLSKRASFTLQPRKHFGVRIELKLSNHVSGTILDSNSKPLQWVCLSLTPAKDESHLACNALADKRGRFRIDSVEAGEYHLILNYENKLTSAMPFPKLYYPGVMDLDRATTISIAHGQNVNGLKIVISRRSNVP